MFSYDRQRQQSSRRCDRNTIERFIEESIQKRKALHSAERIRPSDSLFRSWTIPDVPDSRVQHSQGEQHLRREIREQSFSDEKASKSTKVKGSHKKLKFLSETDDNLPPSKSWHKSPPPKDFAFCETLDMSKQNRAKTSNQPKRISPRPLGQTRFFHPGISASRESGTITLPNEAELSVTPTSLKLLRPADQEISHSVSVLENMSHFFVQENSLEDKFHYTAQTGETKREGSSRQFRNVGDFSICLVQDEWDPNYTDRLPVYELNVNLESEAMLQVKQCVNAENQVNRKNSEHIKQEQDTQCDNHVAHSDDHNDVSREDAASDVESENENDDNATKDLDDLFMNDERGNKLWNSDLTLADLCLAPHHRDCIPLYRRSSGSRGTGGNDAQRSVRFSASHQVHKYNKEQVQS